jgi:hypothetical protein
LQAQRSRLRKKDDAGPAPPRRRSPGQIAKFRESGEIHQWMYDRFSLSRLLRQAGFAEDRVCAAGQSGIPNFNSYGLDLTADGAVRKPDSLFMEAAKP